MQPNVYCRVENLPSAHRAGSADKSGASQEPAPLQSAGSIADLVDLR